MKNPRRPSFKQRKAYRIMLGNGGNITQAMIEAGYSRNTANTPQKLTDSEAWKELMEHHLPDGMLTMKHQELLSSTRLDHMIFPLGPKGEDDINLSGGVNPSVDEDEEEDELEPQAHGGSLLRRGKEKSERTTLTDQEIIQLLSEVNCKVRRIVHGEQARHVYFWAADNKSRKEALELAYKIKGKLTNKVDLTSGGKPIPILEGLFTSKDVPNDNSNEENPSPE